MINKDSLLDAYLSLSGSPLTHVAMMVTLFAEVSDPEDVNDYDVRG